LDQPLEVGVLSDRLEQVLVQTLGPLLSLWRGGDAHVGAPLGEIRLRPHRDAQAAVREVGA
jgi:hypothetical protein